MTVDYPDYATPQAHANTISLTGVPLLHRALNLINDVAHVIGAASSVTLGPVTFGAIGYEISLRLLIPAAATTEFATIDLAWTDSVTGLLVAHETWTHGAGTVAPGSGVIGTGPSKGDTLKITITNHDPAQAMTVTTVVSQNSRIYARDDWRTELFNVFPNFATPTHNQQGNTLATILTGALGIGAAQTRILPLYAGLVSIATWSTTSQRGDLQLHNMDQATPNNLMYHKDLPGGAAFTVTDSFPLPRAQCSFTLTNTDAGAGNILTAWFVIQELLP